MRYRQLGDSGIEVSEISLGSWLTFGLGIADDAAVACIEAAFDAGINFIDTANVYGRGAAEEFLGEVLADATARLLRSRHEALLPDVELRPGLSRAQILKQIDASLGVSAPTTSISTSATAMTSRPARGDDGGAHGGRAQPARPATSASPNGTPSRSGGARPRPARPGRGCEVRLLAAAVLAALARPRAGGDPALRGQRHLADRLVTARSRRPDREVQARRGVRRETPGWRAAT